MQKPRFQVFAGQPLALLHPYLYIRPDIVTWQGSANLIMDLRASDAVFLVSEVLSLKQTYRESITSHHPDLTSDSPWQEDF
jgi:hypothetical protein